MVIEERSDRLNKLKEIQTKFNIKLKTRVSDGGEEIICMDIPLV